MKAKRMLIKTLLGLPLNAVFVALAISIGTVDWAFVCGMASAMGLFIINVLVDKFQQLPQDESQWVMLIEENCDPQTLEDWEHYYASKRWEN